MAKAISHITNYNAVLASNRVVDNAFIFPSHFLWRLLKFTVLPFKSTNLRPAPLRYNTKQRIGAKERVTPKIQTANLLNREAIGGAIQPLCAARIN